MKEKVVIKFQKNKFDDIENNYPYISFKDVRKNYGKKEVLKGINLDIFKGEKISILGHNGSGKTTLTEIISSIKKPSSGQIEYNFVSSKEEFGNKVGIQFQKLNYPEGYKVNEIIPFFNRMVESEKRFSKSELKDLINLFGINNFYNKTLTSLSGGQQQRINLFLTYIKKPSFIILDELSTGLDIDIYDKIVDLFAKYINDEKVTLILVSHNLEEIKRLTDKAYILKNGIISEELETKELDDEKFLNFIRRNEIEFEKNINFNFKINESEKTKLNKYFDIVKTYKYFCFKSEKQIKENVLKIHDKILHLLNEEPIISRKQSKISLELEKVNLSIFDSKEEIKNTKRLIKENKKILDELKCKISEIQNNDEKVLELDKFRKEALENKDEIFEYEKLNTSLKKELTKIEKNKKELNNKLKKVIKENSKLEQKIEKNELTIDLIFDSWIYRNQFELQKIQNIISKNENKIHSFNLNGKNDELKNKLIKKNELLFESIAELNDKKIEIEKFFKEILINEFDQENYLIVRNLKKYYGINPVIDGINLKIKKGSRVAITGPNGSGKTTLMEIISTTLKKTTGKIGYWFTRNNLEAKNKIGMQFQESSFPSDLKVIEILQMFYSASKYRIDWEDLMNLVKVFKVDHILYQGGDDLSGGERQRINILIALLKKPELLILDEISSGLDVESIEDINKYIDIYLEKTGSTLILISHNPVEVKRLTNILYILKNGKIVDKKKIESMSLESIKNIFKNIYSSKTKKREIILEKIQNYEKDLEEFD